MTQAQMTVAVVTARLGDRRGALSPHSPGLCGGRRQSIMSYRYTGRRGLSLDRPKHPSIPARSSLSALQGEREGPAKREGEVGSTANRHVASPALSPRPAGEGKFRSGVGITKPVKGRRRMV